MRRHRRGARSGAAGVLAGAVATPPLIAALAAGWTAAKLPFAPFDLFDALTRVLPGSLLTAGIDSLVSVLRSLDVSSTSASAKMAEQTMAIVVFWIAGVVVGAVVLIATGASRRRTIRAGAVVGAAAGLALARLTPVAELSAAGTVWMIATTAIWGTIVGWLGSRLSGPAISGAAQHSSVRVVDRRQFLVQAVGVSAAFTVTGAVVARFAGAGRRRIPSGGRWSAAHGLPNREAGVVPAPGTRPEYTPLADHYRIDIDTMPPVVDGASWRLAIGGLAERPRELSLAEIRAFPPLDQFITLSCISNPVGGDLIGTTRWTGVSLKSLLPSLRVKPGATHLKITSADGYVEVVALSEIEADARVMLAYAWDGVPLPVEHGFPLRLYIPDRYGMKQPKWIVRIDAIPQWEAGYWVVRGWDRDATVKATSVIDTIAVHQTSTDAEGRRFVPVGGMAYAGARSISSVEVRVDAGDWQRARLRTPLSPLTWVIWRVDLPLQPGGHTVTVRCLDGRGAPQIVDSAPPHPSGASGLDTKSARA